MIMQMLTGREVLRTHYPWQLMTKHAVFMAMEHRRRLEGFEERQPKGVEPISLFEAASESETAKDSESEATSLDDANGNDAKRRKEHADAASDDADEEMGSDAAVVLPEEEEVAPAAAATVSPSKRTTRCRLRNDTFYDDYLHRGSHDFMEGFGFAETPLCKMSLYEYAALVRVVHGNPDALKTHQYAFERHHAKFETFVQELRPSPVPPYVHGFTMPTAERDPETNAMFKQLLLRPHRCKGPKHCLSYDATSEFCNDLQIKKQQVFLANGVPKKYIDGRKVFEDRTEYTYRRQWRRFEARQAALALKADEKIHRAEKFPVLQDVTSCRSWWYSGARRGGEVHTHLAPMLSRICHRTRKEEEVKVWEHRLPTNIVWAILRFAGNFRDAKGDVVCVANKSSEIGELRKVFGMDVSFTSPGVHDEQLTAEELFAWRRSECAARLESMAEARGKPRPGNAHPHAEADDPDGVHGGLAAEDADFEHENESHGSDAGDQDDVAKKKGGVSDPHILYEPYKLKELSNEKGKEEAFFNVLHRYPQLIDVVKGRTMKMKQKMMEKFYDHHELLYQDAQKSTAIEPTIGDDKSTADVADDGKAAFRNQERIMEEKNRESDENVRLRDFAVGQLTQPGIHMDEARRLTPSELPVSPFQMMVPLIARAGIWQSEEQYLATIFLLLPVQQLWERAGGDADNMKNPKWIADNTKGPNGVPLRKIFAHGPGGSGKTYFLTEVVLPVARHFFGEEGTKAIAAHNSAARLLRGSTMHSAGKMGRDQSMKAKKLLPKRTVKTRLENEWKHTACLVCDELGLAAPRLVAAVSRRAYYGRAHLYPEFETRNLQLPVEHPFGDVPIQALAADMMQLNPVKSHSMVEAYCTSKVPGVPEKTTDEDYDLSLIHI